MAGYSGTPLVKKLGKEGMTCMFSKVPQIISIGLSPLSEKIIVKRKLDSEVDFIHAYVVEAKVFQKEFVKFKKPLRKNGMLWVSWPKKAEKYQ